MQEYFQAVHASGFQGLDAEILKAQIHAQITDPEHAELISFNDLYPAAVEDSLHGNGLDDIVEWFGHIFSNVCNIQEVGSSKKLAIVGYQSGHYPYHNSVFHMMPLYLSLLSNPSDPIDKILFIKKFQSIREKAITMTSEKLKKLEPWGINSSENYLKRILKDPRESKKQNTDGYNIIWKKYW